MIAAQCIAYTIYYTLKMFLKYEFKSRLLTCGTLIQLIYFYFSYFLSPTINTTHYNFITDNNNLQYTYPRHTRTLKHIKIFSKSRYLSVQNTFSCRIEVCRAQTFIKITYSLLFNPFQLNYYNKLFFSTTFIISRYCQSRTALCTYYLRNNTILPLFITHRTFTK